MKVINKKISIKEKMWAVLFLHSEGWTISSVEMSKLSAQSVMQGNVELLPTFKYKIEPCIVKIEPFLTKERTRKLRLKCKLSSHGIEAFKRQREGFVVGESRNKECYWVRWHGNKLPYSYHKSFIELLK